MQELQNNDQDLVSIKDLILKAIAFKNLLLKNWMLILSFTIVGVVMGFLFDYFNKKPVVYSSRILFNLDNGSPVSGGGGLSDLASAFGIGGGGQVANTGLFSGNNFFELARTKKIFIKTILSTVDYKGKKVILGNLFIDKSDCFKHEWKDMPEAEKAKFRFKSNDYSKFTLEEKDIFFQVFVQAFECIKLDPGGKTSSFSNISAETRNDTLSYILVKTHLKSLTDFYTQTKTQKTRDLLTIIENRVDSLYGVMHHTQNKLASYQDQNLGMVMQRGIVQQNRLSMNSSQVTGLYFEAMKTLDNLRFSLVKETPLMTIIDDAELPSKAIFPPKGANQKLYGIIGLVLSIIFIVVKNTYRKIMKN
ncbi:MAG: hypothetical protein KA313_04335 [Pseudarcicella sp.]|nr:hypothetical protein [Pseudarcicella sp.]MBP6410306.1 hypothetical protein [Pseudarcicella sp.]